MPRCNMMHRDLLAMAALSYLVASTARAPGACARAVDATG